MEEDRGKQMSKKKRSCLLPVYHHADLYYYYPPHSYHSQTFSSITYLPLHTRIYRHWLLKNWISREWDHWVMMGLIGFFVGLIGASLKVRRERRRDERGGRWR